MYYLIDWSKLKPYKTDKRKSFEEFCYQIAERLYGKSGTFTSIDDSGGGDGVEFYLTLQNSDEWGWQAKFFPDGGRLNQSGRKAQIKKSLLTSLKHHPKLKKWILCTPSDFTTSEITWYKKLHEQTKEKFPDVILEHWDERKFNSFLSHPVFVGIRNYFFGELELSIEWFKKQVNKQLHNVGNKFLPTLHTENSADFYVHALLDEIEFREDFEQKNGNLRNYIHQFGTAFENLKDEDDKLVDWSNTKKKLLAYATQMGAVFAQLDKTFTEISIYLHSNQFDQIKRIDLSSMEQAAEETVREYSQILHDFDPEHLSFHGEEKTRRSHVSNIRRVSTSPLYISQEVVSLLHSVKQNINTVNQNQLTLFGKASIGKTHIACHICQDRISKNLPAILLLGKHFFVGSPIEKQILQILDIPDRYSWNDFIQALNVAAKAHRTKIPIVIDALDEAQTVNIWKNELAGFSCKLDDLLQVALITTCRISYKSEIWQSREPPNAVETSGFEPESVEEAIEKYFNHYKIKADITSTPLEQFSNPMFLRIFCETNNHERKAEKQIYLGEQTLFQVFESYLEQCNVTISSKLSKNISAHVVEEALRRLGRELWKRKDRYIRLSEAVEIIDGKNLAELDWKQSLTYALLDEGLLIDRDLIAGEDNLLFAYNLLGGYIIAKELIQALTDAEIDTLVASQEFEDSLLSENYSILHPLHEDILRCFALLLPTLKGKYLNRISKNQTAFDYSVKVLFEIAPEFVDASSAKLLIDLFAHPEDRKLLLNLAANTMKHVGHPLNIKFWDKLLTDLSMSERDLSWTEYVRLNSTKFLKDLKKFEKVSRGKNPDTVQQLLLLEAKYYRWILTSTIRELRDIATRALYWYGRRFPSDFFDLVAESLAINDHYIPERMLAAAYGVAMALQYDFQNSEFREKILPKEARRIYELMFKENAPYATTHILSRDYAQRFIEIALNHDSCVLSPEEKTRVCPPFHDGGIRNWGESEEKDEGNYREGSMPVHMDFGNYTLGSLVPDRGNYDFENVDYKKVRANFLWRLYDLGYSHDLFAEVDREIYWHNSRFSRFGEGDKADRYGKKYSWIAFFELAGFRQDNSLLPAFFADEDRIPDADIDPSFPDPPMECEIITSDYLGDRSSSLSDWIVNGGGVDVSQNLIPKKLIEAEGPWVLIDGHVSQEDIEVSRSRFILLRGLLVKKHQAAEIVKYLSAKEDVSRSSSPYIPEDHYTYAGEIPWCQTFHYNPLDELRFVVGKKRKRVKAKKIAKWRDGTLLSPLDFFTLLAKKGKQLDKMSEEDLSAFLADEGIEPVDQTVTEFIEVDKTVSYEVQIPVRSYSWESYHSIVNNAGSVIVPAKKLAESLQLCSQPQTFNLYEPSGKLASITVHWGDILRTGHRLTYLRQDLLDAYLKNNALELVWVIWGERLFKSDSIGEIQDYAKKNPAHGIFKDVVSYSSFKVSARNQNSMDGNL